MSDQSSDIPDSAIRVAEDGDVASLVAHLYASGAIDGVTRLLQRKYYGTLDGARIADCIGDAVEATFRAIKNHETIRHPVAFLLKVASNKAADIIESDEFAGRADIDVTALAKNPWAPPESEASVREEAKVKALAIARSYIPRLGQENIQRVMTVLLDAVERNVVDLPHARIAETTGLSVVSVRQLVSRGLKRMCNMAKKDGLHINKYLIDEYVSVTDSADPAVDHGHGEESYYFEDE